MIYLVLAVAIQLAAGATFACAGKDCPLVPEGLAGVYFVLALLVLSLISNFLLTWRGFPLRRVWIVGCVGSALLLSIYGLELWVEFGIPILRGSLSGTGWLVFAMSLVAGPSPLWSVGWLGLLAGEVLRGLPGSGAPGK